jgi:hypothetical protein
MRSIACISSTVTTTGAAVVGLGGGGGGRGEVCPERTWISQQRISKRTHLMQRTAGRLPPRRIHLVITWHPRQTAGEGGQPVAGILIVGMLPSITIVKHLSDESV